MSNAIRSLPSSNLLPQGCGLPTYLGDETPQPLRLSSVAEREIGRLRRANLPGRGRSRARWSQPFRRTSRGIGWLADGRAGIGPISPNPSEQLCADATGLARDSSRERSGNTVASVALAIGHALAAAGFSPLGNRTHRALRPPGRPSSGEANKPGGAAATAGRVKELRYVSVSKFQNRRGGEC